jgi:hypothetical protein
MEGIMRIPEYAKGKPNAYGVYILSEFGNKEADQEAKENWVAKGTTEGRMEIWDAETDRVSTVTIYQDNKGFYIKKKPIWGTSEYRPTKMRLEDFKEQMEG